MNEAAQVLVIILSAVLAVFLVLSIILIVKLIRLTNQISKIADSVQGATDGIEKLIRNLAQISSPFVIVKSIKGLFNKFSRKENKEDVEQGE